MNALNPAVTRHPSAAPFHSDVALNGAIAPAAPHTDSPSVANRMEYQIPPK